MPDTYHPQTLVFPTDGTDWAGSSVDATPLYGDVPITSGFVPANIGIFPMYEHKSPGGDGTWPDNNKPQYRVPEEVTEPFIESSGFPALTLAP